MPLAEVEFKDYKVSIKKALNEIGATEILKKHNKILIKPNCINTSPHPVTTPPECCAAVIEYVKECSPDAEIVIGEGCGSSSEETDYVFKALGYDKIAKEYSVALVDMNYAPLRKIKNLECKVFSTMFLPEMAFTHYLISIPVLKAHSLAEFTGALKNMMGLAPPKYYSGTHGSWKKAVFHERMQQSLIDFLSYRKPDLSIMDATIGLPDYHLGGSECNPPLNKILAGFDSYEVDRRGAAMIGLDWKTIRYLSEIK